MLRSLLIILLTSSFGQLLAQEEFSLTAHPWQVEMDSEALEAETNMIGNKLYFYTNGELLISTPRGSFRTQYDFTGEELVIAGQNHTVINSGESLRIINSDNGRTWQLERALVGIVVQEASPKMAGKFRLDGFYYRKEESSPVSYHYYRFYEDGSVLFFHTIIPPAEVELYLNRAYSSNEQEVRAFTASPASQTDTVWHYDYVAIRKPARNAEEEAQELSRTSKFRLLGNDSIKLSHLSQWSYSERSYSEAYTLAFEPFDVRNTWIGQPLTPGAAGAAHQLLPLPQIPEPEVVLESVDEMPRYPGCEEMTNEEEREQCSMNKMLVFLYSNISYPPIARENGVEGTVVVSMIVEKDGRITNTKILRDIGAQCGSESLRVVRMMQEQDIRWIPGQMYGKPVRVQMNLPVTFRLESRSRNKRGRRGRN